MHHFTEVLYLLLLWDI